METKANDINPIGFIFSGGYIDPFANGAGTILPDLKMRVEFATGSTLESRSRLQQDCEARQIYMMLGHIRGCYGTQIANSIGFDHCTVIHGLKSFRSRFATSPGFRKKVEAIFTHNEYQCLLDEIKILK